MTVRTSGRPAAGAPPVSDLLPATGHRILVMTGLTRRGGPVAGQPRTMRCMPADGYWRLDVRDADCVPRIIRPALPRETAVQLFDRVLLAALTDGEGALMGWPPGASLPDTAHEGAPVASRLVFLSTGARFRRAVRALMAAAPGTALAILDQAPPEQLAALQGDDLLPLLMGQHAHVRAAGQALLARVGGGPDVPLGVDRTGGVPVQCGAR